MKLLYVDELVDFSSLTIAKESRRYWDSFWPLWELRSRRAHAEPLVNSEDYYAALLPYGMTVITRVLSEAFNELFTAVNIGRPVAMGEITVDGTDIYDSLDDDADMEAYPMLSDMGYQWIEYVIDAVTRPDFLSRLQIQCDRAAESINSTIGLVGGYGIWTDTYTIENTLWTGIHVVKIIQDGDFTIVEPDSALARSRLTGNLMIDPSRKPGTWIWPIDNDYLLRAVLKTESFYMCNGRVYTDAMRDRPLDNSEVYLCAFTPTVNDQLE